MNDCQLLNEMYYDLKYLKSSPIFTDYAKNIKKQKRINRFLICCLVIAAASKVTINFNNCEKGTTDVK